MIRNTCKETFYDINRTKSITGIRFEDSNYKAGFPQVILGFTPITKAFAEASVLKTSYPYFNSKLVFCTLASLHALFFFSKKPVSP